MVVSGMLFELADTLQKKRRFIFVALFVVADIWLLSFCTQVLQAHRANIVGRIHTAKSSQTISAYQSNELDMAASLDRMATNIEIAMLRATLSAANGITRVEQGLQAAGRTTVHATSVAAMTTGRAIGHTLVFMGKVIAFPFVMTGRGMRLAFGGVSNMANTHLASVIKPKNDIEVPVITPEQAQQASLIQSDTLNFEPVKPDGSGGACDSGAGNGGYPMEWCNAPRDTLATVPYTNSRINRECTSYAYWYFTEIEGYTDFHVTGNANRWARTSNYPVHKAPAVGGIAVETAGYYGHVAIVQALPGETYEGKVVPDGYVLVSEMNYDWHGHFRYSYSPLSKFTAYIYP